jgi:hypothetical protein
VLRAKPLSLTAVTSPLITPAVESVWAEAGGAPAKAVARAKITSITVKTRVFIFDFLSVRIL